jgi:hypothetical protein
LIHNEPATSAFEQIYGEELMDPCEKPKSEQELVLLLREIIAAKEISGDALVDLCFSVARLGDVFHSFAKYVSST